ncbi:hypothetical protein BpHYR1_013677 [Brachionus plicatilis]|uniref:Uncharacterized protein n=1 Tax=Brachionus plicatilis TaxID=10195 RepID=A0A3M7SXN5_BRAPC|nr:hypothetical protein BpHYR1_013677 [Brachionus plicatilis]
MLGPVDYFDAKIKLNSKKKKIWLKYPELFKSHKTQKKFMLKLQENSDIWQIYCIRQPKTLFLILSDYIDFSIDKYKKKVNK